MADCTTRRCVVEAVEPLRLAGKASFEIFWCDFSVRFDKTLVDGEAPPLPAAFVPLDRGQGRHGL